MDALGPLRAVVDDQRKKAVLMGPSDPDDAIIFNQLESKKSGADGHVEESDDTAVSYNVSNVDSEQKSNGNIELSSESSSSSASGMNNNLMVYPTGGSIFQTFGGASGTRNYNNLFTSSFTQAESETYIKMRKAKQRNDRKKEKNVSKSFVVEPQVHYDLDEMLAQLGETKTNSSNGYKQQKGTKKSNGNNGAKLKAAKTTSDSNNTNSNNKHVQINNQLDDNNNTEQVRNGNWQVESVNTKVVENNKESNVSKQVLPPGMTGEQANMMLEKEGKTRHSDHPSTTWSSNSKQTTGDNHLCNDKSESLWATYSNNTSSKDMEVNEKSYDEVKMDSLESTPPRGDPKIASGMSLEQAALMNENESKEMQSHPATTSSPISKPLETADGPPCKDSENFRRSYFTNTATKDMEESEKRCDEVKLGSLDGSLDETLNDLNRESSRSTESLNSSFVKVTNRKWKKRGNNNIHDVNVNNQRGSVSRTNEMRHRGSQPSGRSATSSYRGSRESSASRASSNSVLTNKERKLEKNETCKSDALSQTVTSPTAIKQDKNSNTEPNNSINQGINLTDKVNEVNGLSDSDFPPLEDHGPLSPQLKSSSLVEATKSLSSPMSSSSSSSSSDNKAVEVQEARSESQVDVWPKMSIDHQVNSSYSFEKDEQVTTLVTLPTSSMPDVCVASDTSRRNESARLSSDANVRPVSSSLPDVAVQASSVPPILSSPPCGETSLAAMEAEKRGNGIAEPAVVIVGEEASVEGLFEFGFDVNLALLNEHQTTVDEPQNTTAMTTTSPLVSFMESSSVSFGVMEEVETRNLSSEALFVKPQSSETSYVKPSSPETTLSKPLVLDSHFLQVISYVAGLWSQVERELKAEKPSVVVYDASTSG